MKCLVWRAVFIALLLPILAVGRGKRAQRIRPRSEGKAG